MWRVKGSASIPAFVDSAQSVTDVAVTAPLAGADVSRAADLTVSWSDGGSASDVYVGAVVISAADTTRHVAGNVVLSSAGSLTVPTANLSLLPAGNATLAISRFRLVYKMLGRHRTGFLVESVTRNSIILL